MQTLLVDVNDESVVIQAFGQGMMGVSFPNKTAFYDTQGREWAVIGSFIAMEQEKPPYTGMQAVRYVLLSARY